MKVTLDGVDITAYVLDRVDITAGRTTFVDPISPASCSLAVYNDALDDNTGVGSAIVIYHPTTVARRFTGTIASITRGQFTTSIICTSSALGAYARAQAPAYTVRNVPKTSGTRTPLLTYVAVDILYNAGLMTDAQLYAATDQNIAGLGAVNPLIATTSIGNVAIEADTGDTLRIGAAIPAGSVLDQLNYLAGHRRAGVVYEDLTSSTPSISVDFTRQYVEAWYASPSYTETITDVTQQLELLTNTVTVTYGTGSTLSTSIASSVATYGPQSLNIETVWDTSSPALGLAIGYLYSRYRPRWLAVPLTVNLQQVPGVDRPDYLQLTPGESWTLGSFYNYIGRAFIPGAAFVEGYNETIGRNLWTVDVYLFDVVYTNTPLTWAEVTPALTWSNVDWNIANPTITWYDMIGAVI